MNWIAKRIAEAQATAPVEAAAASRLEEELTATMCERALTKAELAEVAKQLIVAAEPPEPDHED